VVATTIRVKEFPEEPDKEFFTGLAGLAEELKYSVPGFVQGYFMRDPNGGAMVMAFWQNQSAVDEVLASEVGKYARELYERFLGDGEVERFDVPWLAVFGDEYSKLAARRRVEDPAEGKGRPKKPQKPRKPRG
jgi:hypothetical protein